MTVSPSVWYRRGARSDTGWWHVAAYENDQHPDGDTVATSPDNDPAFADGWLWRVEESDRGILRVRLAPQADGDTPLWFVNVDEAAAGHPASNLVAFATDHFEPGTIVSKYTFASLGVDNNDQVGAVRWYRTGLIHQIFVAPAWRRSGVATALLLTASAYHQAQAWPGKLRADGRRTQLGQHFAAATRYAHRVDELTETMPDMDLPASN